jgi:hypothetical protein
MSGKEQSQPSGTWYTINEGKFKKKVSEETEGAIARKWETPDGKSGIKYELHYNALFGKIEGIKIVDGDYGKQILVNLDKDEDGEDPIIALAVNSKYGVDFLKKLPAIDLSKEVRLMPFNFDNDEGKEVTGLRVDHKDEDGKFKVKVNNFFSDGTKSINGYPDPEPNAKETYSKEDWKNYFGYVVPKFLVTYATENVLPKFHGETKSTMPDYPEEVINPEDIPF